MNTYKIIALIPVTMIFLLTEFKQESEKTRTFRADMPVDPISHVGKFAEPVKVSITGTSVIKGVKGQRPVKVMIYLSKAATKPVLVKYSTKDGKAKAGVDYVATKGSVTFEQGEAAKWITIPIIGEVAADPDQYAPVNKLVEFIVKITEALDATIDINEAKITIVQDVGANPPITFASNQAIYEVIISYTGYTTFFTTAEECGIRPDGIVVLSGFLSGRENESTGDDVRYTGNLEMIIDIDICSVHQLPGSSEDRFCGIRVSGTGTVFTELEINSDDFGGTGGRGGYIKIESKDTSSFKKVVTGDCGEQIIEEKIMVPNKSISSVFNGKELPMLLQRTLKIGTYKETDDQGNVTVVEVLRKIK